MMQYKTYRWIMQCEYLGQRVDHSCHTSLSTARQHFRKLQNSLMTDQVFAWLLYSPTEFPYDAPTESIQAFAQTVEIDQPDIVLTVGPKGGIKEERI